ncbi:MAG: carboxymuconolactone decarboxylase family protein [Thermacetogeniaceae bacterium]|jgi:alkylhydroperoxidase/carboxymuconolactone decarboxylase family protein YurZ
MAVHLPPFVQQLESRDPELYEAVKKVTEVAMTPGALDAKTKTLISLALDAYIGAERGVMVLASRARDLGATEQEINETLRISYSVSGSRCLAASAGAFQK